ncbi:MAG TPA: GGDEF domain-containing protein [Acetobacteraceae bacterium]|nr:GGDEF domain-containing protein [Acetobacteraceae bacterium]
MHSDVAPLAGVEWDEAGTDAHGIAPWHSDPIVLAAAAVDAVPHGLVVLDARFRVVLSTAEARRLLDIASGRPLGLPLRTWLETQTHLPQAAIAALERVCTTEMAEDAASEVVPAGERDLLLRVEALPAHARAVHVAEAPPGDRVTGLLDRNAFMRQAAALLARQPALGDPPALLWIELGGVDVIRLRLGPAVADALLRVVAQRLQRAIRADDRLARVAEDELALLLPEGAAAAHMAPRVRELLGRPFQVHGHLLAPEVRIGTGLAADPGMPVEALVQAAIAALA